MSCTKEDMLNSPRGVDSISEDNIHPECIRVKHVPLLFTRLHTELWRELTERYVNVQENVRRQRRLSKETTDMIKDLYRNAGRASVDSFYQQHHLEAIEGSIKKLPNDHYPPEMRKNLNCHIRALWNINKDAARNALHQDIKHHDYEGVKRVLSETVTEAERCGNIYCLRRQQENLIHWVSLTPTAYYDDFAVMKTLNYDLGTALLKCLELDENQFGRCPENNFAEDSEDLQLTKVSMDDFIKYSRLLDVQEERDAHTLSLSLLGGGSETGVACGVEGQVSALQSPISPPIPPSKKHTDANTDANTLSLLGCGSETGVACGVEGQVSALQSPISPPIPPSKKRTSKKRARSVNRHKKRKCTPTRIHPRHAETNNQQSVAKLGGCRKVLNKLPMAKAPPGSNERTCLADAIYELLPDNASRKEVISSIHAEMPPEGDTSIKCVNIALSKHGMVLERTSAQYNQRGGWPYHLFKERECKLVVNIKLGSLEDKSAFASHFVAWDGKVISDRPHCMKVNGTSDRANPESSKSVFERLYHKKAFSSWQITNVYRLIHQGS